MKPEDLTYDDFREAIDACYKNPYAWDGRFVMSPKVYRAIHEYIFRIRMIRFAALLRFSVAVISVFIVSIGG